MKDRPLHLRTMLSAATLLVVLLTVGIAVAFAFTTPVMHRSAARLADSAESIILGERVELDLHHIARMDDDSQPGGGSTLLVRIPLARESQAIVPLLAHD